MVKQPTELVLPTDYMPGNLPKPTPFLSTTARRWGQIFQISSAMVLSNYSNYLKRISSRFTFFYGILNSAHLNSVAGIAQPV
jgi:hypothetical protein